MKIGKEGKRKLKASLANTALFLSIFIVLFPLSMPNVSAGDGYIIYVDDDAPDGGNGTESSPFNSIDYAVDHAQLHSGNVTVRVYNGTYLETVTINSGAWTTLTLEGNHSSNTTIDADHDGTVIEISASWVKVTGFT
ncbi:MAG: hypothetical protein ACXACR_15375 [Candidatus Hodarchaeales archaeon]